MLSFALAGRGHRTTWFTSTFDHYQKRQRSTSDHMVDLAPNLSLHVLRAPGYAHNVSLPRILHNRKFAQRWLHHAQLSAERPDVLVTDVPTTEAAQAVVRFGQKNGIPTVVSVRDVWPDSFVQQVPGPLRRLAKPFVALLDNQVRYALRNATSLIGISPRYLEWGQDKAGRRDRSRDRIFALGFQPQRHPETAEIENLRRSYDIPQGATVVCFVGSWGSTTDAQLLLETATTLAHRQDVVFVFAGNAEANPRVSKALSNLPNVRLPGWLSRNEMARLIAASAVGLLPYKSSAPQGLPNKAFEYMAYGAYQLAAIDGELGTFYAETGAGQVAAAASFAGALTECLSLGADPTERARRIEVFEQSFSADAIYDPLVRHIEEFSTPGLSLLETCSVSESYPERGIRGVLSAS